MERTPGGRESGGGRRAGEPGQDKGRKVTRTSSCQSSRAGEMSVRADGDKNGHCEWQLSWPWWHSRWGLPRVEVLTPE